MLVLIGKTATGKTRIKDELVKMGYESVVTTTTRPMRDGEIQDVTYHFVDKSQFRRMDAQGLFAETTSYNTVHGRWYYGTQLADLENDENKVIILNPDGIKSLPQKMDISKWFVVYLDCPEEIISERLKNRGDDTDEVIRRMEADRKDFENISKYICCTITNDGTRTPLSIAGDIAFLYKNR